MFKTVTRDPNNLNPPSNNAVNWPWDQDFFLILNVAVGGWYSGNPEESAIINGNTSWSANMQVDYVKVYTDLSGGELTGSINGKTSVLPGETGILYSIPATEDATYAWSASNGSIVSGNGTNSVEVTWGTGSGTVEVVKTIDCGSASYTLPVTIMPVSCGTMLEDFEFTRFSNYGYIHGQLNPKENNPAPSAENTSPVCAQYIRNPAEEFDVIVVENPNIGNADLIENNTKRFMMDVYSNAAGRNIEITLENSNTSSAPYPTGRHSTYRATTTVANAWETLTFEHIASPEPGLAGTSVNRLVLLFTPGSYNSHTFYFDNLLLNETPAAGTITGAATVCNDQANVSYSVPNKSGVTYTWGIPADAVINSGQGTNTLNVTFGSAGGNISVTPAVGTCTGTTVSRAITNNSCTPTGTLRASMSQVHLFPNPASDIVMLSLNSEYQTGTITVQILESTGKVISENTFHNPSGDEIALPLTDLKAGHYLLKISSGDNSFVKNMLKK